MTATSGTKRRGAGLFAVPGIDGAAVRTGVKPSGDLDLALIRAAEPMSAAAVFTTNAAAAAPVHVSRAKLAASPFVRCVVVNSGNANALTGPRGRADAEAMVSAAEARCGGPALVLSTGVIGVPLPIDAVLAGIDAAADRLGTGGEEEHAAVARAILTTDTAEKIATATTETTPAFTVGGIAKGSGMIHPHMATMLAVIATDAPVGPDALAGILGEAVDRSFHEISVDGDTSTNDAVLLLARRPGDGTGLDREATAAVAGAVTEVSRELARQIVEDGEGATRLMHIEIDGAATPGDARRVARGIACSALVKTALAGGDPNWGRILSAAGAAGGGFSPETAELTLGDEVVFAGGEPKDVDVRALERAFSGRHVRVRLDLGRGRHAGRMTTTDLTHEYVEINSAYTT